MSAQRVRKGIQMGAKWNPNGTEMAPWKPLGAPWPPAGLLERSGKPFGRLLEAFGAQKTKLGSALGRPKGTKQTGFALLEGQMSAQKRIQEGPKSRSENDPS